MLTFDERDVIDVKMSLVKDLEKKIKMGYRSQFQNVAIKIVTKQKRYKKIKTPINPSEDLAKIENTSRNIYQYLMNMFDVFGENAILNAKRIFEENGLKWGKRVHKSLQDADTPNDIKKLLKELYISVKDMDYIQSHYSHLSWVFKKPSDNGEVTPDNMRYFHTLYDIKALWLQNFLKALAPNYTSILEVQPTEDDNDQITTNIIIKEGA